MRYYVKIRTEISSLAEWSKRLVRQGRIS